MADPSSDLEQLAESVPAIFWATDANGVATYYNRRWYDYTGNPPGDLSADAWSKACHPDDLPRIRERWENSLATGEGFEIELRLKAASGIYRWHLARATPVRGPAKRVVKWLGVSIDIDSAKQAQAEASAQREWLLSILVQAPVPIALYAGPQYVIDVANDFMCRVWGRKPEQVLGKTYAEVFPEMVAQGILGIAFDPVFQTGKTFFANAMEVKFDRRGDGVLREGAFNFVHVPLRRRDGVTEGIVAVATEVTEELAARKRVEALANDLRDSEEQFRTLANSIPQLAWIAEADGSIRWYNQRWYEYTGTTPEQMAEQDAWGWQRVHDPAELPRVIARFKAAIASGEPWEDTFPLRRRDGEFRWHLSRAMPVRNATGKIVHWFGTNTDIEEQRRQAAQFKEAIQARDTFLSVASHELKTPLTPISLRLQSLARELERQPQSPFIAHFKSYVAVTQKQIDRLTRLVNDLLDVSRISAGRFRMELERADLVRILEEAVARFQLAAERAGCAITLEAPASLPSQTAPLRLDQVVSNLLDNAIKYGAGQPIRVALGIQRDRAMITVADQGIGIPKERMAKVFERFERAVSERNYGGLGLGLYISRTIVESLGGHIGVESGPSGTTFTVELPLNVSRVQPELPQEEITTSLAGFFQISPAHAAELLRRAFAGETWEPGPIKGTFLLPVQAGDSLGATKAFLVRIQKGVTYPYHVHEGEERVFIFQGGLLEPDGTELWAGDERVMPLGSGHWSKAKGDRDCYLAAVELPRPSLGGRAEQVQDSESPAR